MNVLDFFNDILTGFFVKENKEKMEEESIKKEIKRFQSEGKKILATWDAGNDSTLCNVVIEDFNFTNTSNSKLIDYLRYQIIDVLQLPNASEDQHVGNGSIQLNENQEVILIYDNIHKNPYHIDANADAPKEDEAITLTFQYEDIYGIAKYLTRIAVTFYAYSESKPTIQIRILEGDEILFDDDNDLEDFENHLSTVIQDITKPHFQILHQIPENIEAYSNGTKQELSDIHIEGELIRPSTLRLVIHKCYEYITYTKNKTVMLIP